MRRIAALLGFLLLVGLVASGQEQDAAGDVPAAESDNGFILNFIQERISGPGREISLSGVEGALSSQAKIGAITVSDDAGPWLEIRNVTLDWNRLALLRRRVSINELRFDTITLLRRPIPVAAAPQPEARSSEPFALPELPVAVRVDSLVVEHASLGESVIGEAVEFRVNGHAALADGALDSGLDVQRLDQPGGSIALEADYANENRQLTLNLDLEEPAGGLASKLLNVEGRPPLSLSVAGSGPLDNVDIDFDLRAAQTTLADGVLALRGHPEGQGFDLTLGGEISPLIPADYRDFFAAETNIRAAGVNKRAGGLRLDALNVQGAVLDLTGRLETGQDNFLQSLNLSGAIGDPAGPAVLLPVPGADTRLHSGRLYVNYGAAARWDGLLVLDRLEASGIEIEDLTLDMGGLAQNLDDPQARNVTLSVDGLATGVHSDDPDVAAALGSELSLFVDATLPAGAPVAIRQAQLTGDNLSLFAAGSLDGLVYDGRAAARVPDLALFSGLAKREMTGALTLRANGSVDPRAGKFAVALNGTTSDVSIGDARVDGLLAGETLISGRALRDERGIRTENLLIENPQLRVSSDGLISTARTDMDFMARITDLAALDPRFAGTFTAEGHAEGDGQPVALDMTLSLPEGRIMDKPARDLVLAFRGEKENRDIRGLLSGDGRLADLPFDLAGFVASATDGQRIRDLVLSLGQTRVAGSLSHATGAPILGELALQAPDLAPLGALLQLDTSGAVSANLRFDGEGEGETLRQDLDVQASLRSFAFDATTVDDLSADLRISDLAGIPMAEGEIDGSGIMAGGIDIASLTAVAQRDADSSTRLTTNARFTSGTLADLSGVLARLPEGGFATTLDAIDIRQGNRAAQLAEPSTITVRDGNVEISPLRLDIDEGHLTASGMISDTLDLQLDMSRLPLSIANLVKPDLGLGGTLEGSADVTGTRAAPDISFTLTGAGLTTGALGNAGLPPLSVAARGTTSNALLNLDATLSGTPNLSARARGQVPLSADGAYDLTVDLQSFPLVIVDRVAGNQGLRGELTGQARVTGRQADPQASFQVEGSGLSARILSENAVPPLALAIDGRYAANTVNLASARVTGPYGLELGGSGRIPLAGSGLDLRIAGVVPLQLSTPILAERAASAAGNLDVNATATGALADPQVNGEIRLAGGSFTDPDTNLRLQDIGLDVALSMSEVVIRSLTAESAAGGSITGNGSIGLSAAQNYPADIDVDFDSLRYTDGVFLSTELDGSLDVTGPLVGDGGRISGRIVLGRTELSIEEGLGSNAGAILEEVQHLQPPPRVIASLARANVGQREAAEGTGNGDGGLALDIRVTAPNQIFIRGRGLDAELGGQVTIGGTTNDIAPVGQFDMRRGRISILTQRIDFTEGSLELDGNLDPLIDFTAATSSGDVTAMINVTGRASDPQITFTSEPELPQDEVLSRLLFNRAAQNLSPFQLAQLAAAAAELAGVSSGGPGILDELRGATGLDNLDILTEEDGTTAVSAGKYVADDVYLDVQTDSRGQTEAGVVYDLNDNITARGSVGSDGNTTFGLFFERDY